MTTGLYAIYTITQNLYNNTKIDFIICYFFSFASSHELFGKNKNKYMYINRISFV